MKIKHLIIGMTIFLILLGGCRAHREDSVSVSSPIPKSTLTTPSTQLPPTISPTSSPTQTTIPLVTNPTTTPLPTNTPQPTLTASPTLIVTTPPVLDTTQLTFSELPSSTTYQRYQTDGQVMRVPGRYCESHAFQWLDNAHLLLYPSHELIPDEFGDREYTWPIVLNVSDGSIWIPPLASKLNRCSNLQWSASHQLLLVPQREQILLFDVSGNLVRSYPGRFAHLSPSGNNLYITNHNDNHGIRHLSTDTFTPLDNDITVPALRENIAPISWSFDETHLFSCCFQYADTTTNQAETLNFENQLSILGRGVPNDWSGFASQWVLNDTAIFVHTDLSDLTRDLYATYPLLDPVTETFFDAGELIGLPFDEIACKPNTFAPDGINLTISCTPIEQLQSSESGYDYAQEQFVINSQSGWSFQLDNSTFLNSWSPDGQIAVVQHPAQYTFLSTSDGTELVQFESAPIWSHTTQYFAYLTNGNWTLNLFDFEQQTAINHIDSPREIAWVEWHPDNSGLIVGATDGSLWWLPDLSATELELITPSFDYWPLQWSPNWHYIAAVNEAGNVVIQELPQE